MAVVAGAVRNYDDETLILVSGPQAHLLAQEFAEWKNSQEQSSLTDTTDEGWRRDEVVVANPDPARQTWVSTTSACHFHPEPR
jgi:hypothetical protein